MAELVEPPKNVFARLWRKVPESWRLPLVFIVPAVVVVALMPLLFLEGGVRGLVGIRDVRGAGPQDGSGGGLFSSRQPAAPVMAMPPSQPAQVPAAPSSLTRPVDGALAFGGGASAAPGEAGQPEKDESQLEKAQAPEVEHGDAAAASASAGPGAAGGRGMPRLAARSSQFSYGSNVGHGAGSSAKLRAFDFKKGKSGGAGSAIGAGPGSLAGAAAGPADASGAANALKSMQSGNAIQGSGSAGAANMGSTDGGSGDTLQYLLGGSGDSGGASIPGVDPNAMINAKKCQDANAKYSPLINQKQAELNAVNRDRYQVNDCRTLPCRNYATDCDKWANERGVFKWYYRKICVCGHLACRSINACRSLNALTCQFQQACPTAGSCSNNSCT